MFSTRPSPVYRTGGPITTWKIQVLLVLQNFYRTYVFFSIRITIEGLPTAIFFTGQEDHHNKGFHLSPTTVFTNRGPRTSGFPDVFCELLLYDCEGKWHKSVVVFCQLYVNAWSLGDGIPVPTARSQYSEHKWAIFKISWSSKIMYISFIKQICMLGR